MLLTQLTLRNFGIYKGTHKVDLDIDSPDKPIILIGALNGAGKTTILDALQLVLYGKFANSSNRGKLAYNDYLLKTINRYAPPSEGAQIYLEFKHHFEGKVESYRIVRSWALSGSSIREVMEVYKDSVMDNRLTEDWYEYVDQFIPQNIAPLFFFDGEKIEQMAQPTNAKDILRTGIQALLGLDIVDELQLSLKNRTKLRREKLDRQVDSAELNELANRTNSEETKLKELVEKLATFKSKLDAKLNAKESLDTKFKAVSGPLAEQRSELESKQALLKTEIANIKKDIIKIASGIQPLFLVDDLVRKAHKQAIREREARNNALLVKSLKNRDTQILQKLYELSAGNTAIDEISRFLAQDVEDRLVSAATDEIVKTPPSAFDTYFSADRQEVSAQKTSLQYSLSSKQEQYARIEEKLSLAPEGPDIEDLITSRNQNREDLLKIQGAIEHLEQEIVSQEKQLLRAQQSYNKKLSQQADNNFLQSKGLKVIAKAEEIEPILTTFKQRITKQNTSRLEGLILDSFVELSRKEQLVTRITIDPDDFSLSLYDTNNQLFGTERLSAGERQLLAVAILWGLAKASKMPLPNIIDTPLGRLDSKHRTQLINNYYPNASHQVLILSTDEEVVGEYYEQLKPYISKEYLLSYNEKQQSSEIRKGYFTS